MSTEVLMPQLGESVVEGTITKWLKAIGEPVKEYEPLLEVNTDKVDSEIPSPAAGVLLDIKIPEGTTVHAGTVLAVIGAAGEAASKVEAPQTAPKSNGVEKKQAEREEPLAIEEEAVSPELSTAAPASAAEATPGPDRDLGFISPVVARIAREQEINLNQVTGTGQGGRITKKDVLAYIEQQKKAAAAPMRVSPASPAAAPVSPMAASPTAPTPAARPTPAPVFAGDAGDEVVPLSTVRRSIAEHMVFSERTSPHVTTVMEADLSQVVAHREANKSGFAREGVKLTFSPYFVAASVAALKAFPIVNSSWSDEGIIYHRHINIGLAASLGEAGLIVPVIKNAGDFSLIGLARAVNDLADRARSRKLQPDEVKDGTFTITNHGTTGSLFATPIINQPQCAILGVGIIQKRVIVINDAIAIRPMVYLSLTFDHRILDGAVADGFLGKVVEYLQEYKERI